MIAPRARLPPGIKRLQIPLIFQSRAHSHAHIETVITGSEVRRQPCARNQTRSDPRHAEAVGRERRLTAGSPLKFHETRDILGWRFRAIGGEPRLRTGVPFWGWEPCRFRLGSVA